MERLDFSASIGSSCVIEKVCVEGVMQRAGVQEGLFFVVGGTQSSV